MKFSRPITIGFRFCARLSLYLAGCLAVAASDAAAADVNLTGSPGYRAECAIDTDPVNPDTMVVVGHPANGDTVQIETLCTYNAGSSWTRVTFSDSLSPTLVSDPSVAFAPTGDTVYVAYMSVVSSTRYLVCARSTNGGAGYDRVTVIDTIIDKPFIATGTDNAGGHHVYISYNDSGGLWLVRSKDEGFTFDTHFISNDICTPASFSDPAANSDGDISVVYYAPDGGFAASKIMVATAPFTSGSLSFATPDLVGRTALGVSCLPATIDPAPTRGIYTVPSIAIDTGSSQYAERMYVTYAVTNVVGIGENDDVEVVCQYSDDSGDTWSVPRLVHKTNGNSQFHPWVSVDPSGAVAVVYYDGRNDVDNESVEVFVSASTDGGVSWFEHKLSDFATDVSCMSQNFLEYIGGSIQDGVIRAVWSADDDDSGCQTGTVDFYFDSVGLTTVMDQDTLYVPGDFASIQEAIDTAEAGDIIYVSGDAGDQPIEGSFTLSSNIEMSVDPENPGRPILDADGEDYVVVFPKRYTGDGISGCDLQGFAVAGVYSDVTTNAVAQTLINVTDCSINGGDYGVLIAGGHVTYSTVPSSSTCSIIGTSIDGAAISAIKTTKVATTVDSCAIHDGDSGVESIDADLTVSGCTIEDCLERGVSVTCDEILLPATITGNLIRVTPDSSLNSSGIFVDCAEAVDFLTIQSNTIDGWGTGIELFQEVIETCPPSPPGVACGLDGWVCCGTTWVCLSESEDCPESPSELGMFTISKNMVTNAADVGIECADINGSLTCNNAWTLNGSIGAYSGFTSPLDENTSLTPLYCAEHDETVREFTLRIDSPGAPGNSICGELIGAFPVECAWDTLVAGTTVAEGTEVRVLEDVVVAVGDTLTILPGVQLGFDTFDNSGGGLDTLLVELIVRGVLDAEGSDEDPIGFFSPTEESGGPFTPPPPGPGSWYGIRFVDEDSVQGSGKVIHAEVLHGVNGISLHGDNSVQIRNSLFALCDPACIVSAVSSHDLVIDSNGIQSTTIGLDLGAADSVMNNQIYGPGELGGTGVRFTPGGAWVDTTLFIDNDLSGGGLGLGFQLGGDSLSVLKGNAIEALVGIVVDGGKHIFGVRGDEGSRFGGGNEIHTLGDGISATRSGAGSCPSSFLHLIVRNSVFECTAAGIEANNAANDSLSLIDVGTEPYPSANPGQGFNSFTGTTGTSRSIKNNSSCGTIPARGNYFGNYSAITGAVDTTGTWDQSGPAMLQVGVDPDQSLRGFVWLGVVPNPVTRSASLLFDIYGDPVVVTATLFDIAGRVVRSFGQATFPAGRNSLNWNGLDETGHSVSNGIYFVRIDIPGKKPINNRIVVLR